MKRLFLLLPILLLTGCELHVDQETEVEYLLMPGMDGFGDRGHQPQRVDAEPGVVNWQQLASGVAGPIVFTTTEDGWRLTLTRYRPTHPLAGAPPVVLCPPAGLSSAIALRWSG